MPAESFTITVIHQLDEARNAEVIEVPWNIVREYISNPMIDHLRVSRIADGAEVSSQVINYPVTAGGAGMHALIFQHDFSAGEKSAAFLIETTDQVVPPYPVKVFARYVPERYDDFAWENDLLAHRAYGPALATPAAPGVKKEVLVSSGIDIWGKRVGYPIINRWYQKEHEGIDYHTDTGEGADFYSVNTARGAGGTGIWDGRQLHASGNWTSWRVLSNGPIRAVFELSYHTWDAGGSLVSEIKRFAVDAGHQLDRIESTITVTNNSPEFLFAVGISKHTDISGLLNKDQSNGWLAYWETYPEHGQLGTGVVLANSAEGFAADAKNNLILTPLDATQPITYYVGAAWDQRGDITSAPAWSNYLAAFARRLRSPLQVSFSHGNSD